MSTPLPRLSENPFRIPDAETIFRMRDEEKREAAQRRALMRSQSIFEKSTVSSSTRAETLVRDELAAADAEEAGRVPSRGGRRSPLSPSSRRKKGRALRAARERQNAKKELLKKAGDAIRRHNNGEKQSLYAFIQNKRKMFEIKYKIGVKLEAIQKLMEEEHRRMTAVNKQKDLLGAEEDKFQEYKDEINEKLQEAAQRAEHEEELKKQQKVTKDGLVEEINKLRRKIEERDRLLSTYSKYKTFLEEINRSAAAKGRAQARVLSGEATVSPTGASASGSGSGEPGAIASRRGDDSSSSAALPGSSPEALLEIFKDLEDSNLFLIQNLQELQEQLACVDEQLVEVKHEADAEVAGLEEHKASLQALLDAERSRLEASEVYESYFEQLNSEAGKGSSAAHAARHKSRRNNRAKKIDILEGRPTDERIELIRRKVIDVYKRTKVGTSEILDVIPMLTNLEKRLQELFHHVGRLDESAVDAEEKARAKREKEANRKKTKQEQATLLARRKLDQDRRAKLPLKRKMGKPLMPRSDPHTKKQQHIDSDAEKQRDAEMYSYFFG